MKLSENNIQKIANTIREKLYGKSFTIETITDFGSDRESREVEKGCTLAADWTDRSTEMVRVIAYDTGTHWIAFTAGRYFYTYAQNCKAEVKFNNYGFSVKLQSGSGDWHKHIFRVTGSA